MATTYYWISTSTSTSTTDTAIQWNNPANWSLSSGGPPTTTYPNSSSHDVVFDRNSGATPYGIYINIVPAIVGNFTVTAAGTSYKWISIGGLSVYGNYTGPSSAFSVVSNGNMTMYEKSGGSTISGYLPGISTLQFSSTTTAATFTLNSALSVLNLFLIGGTGLTNFNTNGYNLTVRCLKLDGTSTLNINVGNPASNITLGDTSTSSYPNPSVGSTSYTSLWVVNNTNINWTYPGSSVLLNINYVSIAPATYKTVYLGSSGTYPITLNLARTTNAGQAYSPANGGVIISMPSTPVTLAGVSNNSGSTDYLFITPSTPFNTTQLIVNNWNFNGPSTAASSPYSYSVLRAVSYSSTGTTYTTTLVSAINATQTTGIKTVNQPQGFFITISSTGEVISFTGAAVVTGGFELVGVIRGSNAAAASVITGDVFYQSFYVQGNGYLSKTGGSAVSSYVYIAYANVASGSAASFFANNCKFATTAGSTGWKTLLSGFLSMF